MNRASNRTSLITVTHASLSPDDRRATIYVTVLPDSEEENALAFLKRNRTDFREYVKKQTSLKFIPTLDFMLDVGEKNRQDIEALSLEEKPVE